MTSVSHRYRSLDAVRGLAAFGVVLFHYRNHFGAAPFVPVLQPVYQRGVIFVDLFFVMSGYLLVTIYAGRRDFWALAWRRIARLVPLHWATLAVVTILQPMVERRLGGTPYIYGNNDAYHFLLNLLLLHCSGLSKGFSFDGPAWSISVEWLVNLLLFGLLASGIKRVHLAASALALAAALTLWTHGRSVFAEGRYGGILETLLLRGVFGFFVGVALTELVPLAARPEGAPPKWERAAGHLWDVVLVLSVAALRLFMASNRVEALPGASFGVVLVVIPALVAGAVHGRWASRLLALAPLQWLGKVSYSLYLVHFPMQALFVLLFPPPDRWLDYAQPRILAAYLAATLVTSYLTWRLVEAPAQSLLQRVSIRPATAS